MGRDTADIVPFCVQEWYPSGWEQQASDDLGTPLQLDTDGSVKRRALSFRKLQKAN